MVFPLIFPSVSLAPSRKSNGFCFHMIDKLNKKLHDMFGTSYRIKLYCIVLYSTTFSHIYIYLFLKNSSYHNHLKLWGQCLYSSHFLLDSTVLYFYLTPIIMINDSSCGHSLSNSQNFCRSTLAGAWFCSWILPYKTPYYWRWCLHLCKTNLPFLRIFIC